MTTSMINNRKRLSISSKRQITIPQVFFNALGFEDEAECIYKGNELIIRPISSNISSNFSEQILAELIEEGYSGEKMLSEFKARQAKIKPAITRMLEEADAIAKDEAKYMTMEDVFGEKK